MDTGQGGELTERDKKKFLNVNIINYAKLDKGRVKYIARSQKAALKNLIGFGGVKLLTDPV